MIIDKREAYSELDDFLLQGEHAKELFILTGVYGVGKTTLLNVLSNKLNDRLHIHLNFNKFDSDGLISLKNAVLHFISRSKIENTKQKFKVSSFLANLVRTFELKASASVGTENAAVLNAEVNILEAIRSTIESKYERYLETIDKAKSTEFPQTLARIVVDITGILYQRIYITLDEIEKLDCNSAIFIEELLKSNCDLSIVCSTESKRSEINNYHYISTINNFFTRNIETVKCISTKLSEFNVTETSQYINLKYKSNYGADNPLIIGIHEKTAGLPLLLSVICANNSLEEIIVRTLNAETEEWLGKIYNETINSFEEQGRRILYLLSIAGGTLTDPVLREIANIPNGDMYRILGMLQKKEMIVYDEQNDEFNIKYRILSEYIQHSDHITAYEEKKLREQIINAYENSPLQSISKARTLSYLYLKSKAYNNAFEWTRVYGNLAFGKCMYDRFINDSQNIKQTILLEAQNMAKIDFLLVRAYYYSGDIESCIHLFTSLETAILDALKLSEDYSLLCGTIAQAYYYRNDYRNTIKYCKEALENSKNNHYIFHESFLRLISAYDLNGQYALALDNYNKGIRLANQKEDSITKGSYLMVTQMVHNKFQDCCKNLEEAIQLFEDTNYKRNLACVHNNLGIEYLMYSNHLDALKHLKKSEKIFNQELSLELHFVQNNLALYFLLNNQMSEARASLTEALRGAISPLQHAYIYSNLAVLNIMEDNDRNIVEELFEQALYYTNSCPDPVVHCNVKYNYAKYVYSAGNHVKAVQLFPKEKLSLINTKQYSPLIEKSIILSKEIGIAINDVLQTNQRHTTDRRACFIKQEWQLCELMFYN
ncbi:P-loop NTPase fold protein [Paenibacillus camerounensis]|uniref:P-loop NTPase fold protein n=1 Tax=Paenibacillus camerounensis TaxID=1243663 RepID=UPI0005A9027D|nr:P-loop NTPase fold protein [Paenibacillus camerounensis]